MRLRALAGSTWKWLLGLFLLCAIVYAAGLYPLARFKEETVNITAHPASIDVSGSYLFENIHHFPIRQTLTYPVATDNGLSRPDTILVQNADSAARPVPVHNTLGVYSFMIALRPKEKAWCRVSYTQNAPSRQAAYVLTSTQSWGRPLYKAVFRLRTEGVNIVESNYPLDKLSSANTSGFERRNFMPAEDWTFAWEVL